MLTPSFARSLRKTAMVRYRDMAERYGAAVETMLIDAYQGKWTSKRANAFWKQAGAKLSRHCFGTFYLAPHIVTFAPFIEGERITVQTVRLHVPSRHRPMVYDGTVALELGPHAVERLFLRLDTVDPLAAQSQIMHALLIAGSLRAAADLAGARQVPLPTANGAFLCEVIDGQPLFARTWLRSNDPTRGHQSTALKWQRVIEALMNAFARWSEADGAQLARRKLQLAAAGSVPQREALAAALAAALAEFLWLKSPYAATEDVNGTVWEKARAQERAGTGLVALPLPPSNVAQGLSP